MYVNVKQKTTKHSYINSKTPTLKKQKKTEHNADKSLLKLGKQPKKTANNPNCIYTYIQHTHMKRKEKTGGNFNSKSHDWII